jgi:hydroxymethylpyrimidine/phosphomethylpyrimidine kinase
MSHSPHVPGPVNTALTIAGSDSGGGAGIQADLKTFSALHVYGASVITALTAQNTQGVTGVHDVRPDFVRAQIDAVYSDLTVKATKIGMLSDPATIGAVVDGLNAHRPVNVVLDPVMVATSGDPLLKPDAVAVLKATLIPMADLITPNLQEAKALTGRNVAGSVEDMIAQGRMMLQAGAKAVLIKGGHSGGNEVIDILVTSDDVERFSAPRIDTKNTHGTGCTLSAAIAAGLAKGLGMVQAIAAAKAYLTDALREADRLHVGKGHGPVHHFHALWRDH